MASRSKRPEPPDPVQRVLDEILAPLVARDGGMVRYVGRDGGVVEIALEGACRGCPGQPYTLRDVVLPALRAADATVGDVRVVRAAK